MKLRNITEHTLVVPLLNATVEPDAVVEVPRDVYESHDWPESTWTVVAASKTNK